MTRMTSLREAVREMVRDGVAVEQVKAATGWPLKISEALQTTRAPDAAELAVLPDLLGRTAEKHGRAEAADA
jgi:glutaconate CoA-transferase, subunit B